jgi:hypothetical protein
MNDAHSGSLADMTGYLDSRLQSSKAMECRKHLPASQVKRMCPRMCPMMKRRPLSLQDGSKRAKLHLWCIFAGCKPLSDGSIVTFVQLLYRSQRMAA